MEGNLVRKKVQVDSFPVYIISTLYRLWSMDDKQVIYIE